MKHLSSYLKREGWIIAAIIFCAALCLILGSSEGSSSEESHVSSVLSAIAGAGTVEVAVHYEDTVPCGAVVVADGAGDVAVQLRLLSAVTRLLGIDQSRVAIYEREGP